jgi:cell division GTPase FtsZ
MKILLIGSGAAGNKVVYDAITSGAVKEEDTIIINSTDKDFPKEYEGKTIIISPKGETAGGVGKEIKVARHYAVEAIKEGLLNDINTDDYDSVVIVSSTEGGTGSGSTPVFAKYFSEVVGINTHVIALTGDESDVRGMMNTIEFFKSLSDKIIVQAIANASFMREAGNNKIKAEQLANKEVCKRLEIMTGKNFIVSDQNIDDTDILKVSNTFGYMTVESAVIRKPLIDQEDFNKVIKQMIYNSHSIKSVDPGAARIGVILNINPASEDAVDYTFDSIIQNYGKAYETFLQKQWDGKQEYINFIVSGMKMPIDEISAIYERYKEQTERVNKNADSFYAQAKELVMDDSDKIFDMVRGDEVEKKTISVDSFLNSFE